MKAIETLKKACRKDASATVLTVVCGLVGCWALIDGEWSNAAIFLSLSALVAATLWRELAPTTKRLIKRTRVILLGAALGFLGVGCAAAARGDVFLAVVGVLAGVLGIYNAFMERHRRKAGRPKVSI